MKFIALAFLGVALATYSTPTLPVPLKVNTEYRYRFEGSLESGLPVNSEASNTRVNCNVIFQVTDDRTVLCRLQDIKFASEHTTTENKMLPLESLQSRVLPSEHKNILEKPVRFFYKSGMISDIQFDSEETVSSANFKRGVISMIQLNINKIGEEMESVDREPQELNDFFTTNEKTVEGECQVSYNIVEDKKDRTVVTKSINFEKCTKRPEIRYGYRFVSECPECDKESRMLVPQTVYNYKIEKDLLKEVELVSTYLLTLKEQPAMKTTIRSRIVLEESTDIRREIEAPRGQKQDLIYNTEWEEKVERFFKNGDEENNMIFEEFSGKMEHTERFLTRIAELDKNEPESVHILARLVRAFRLSSIPELKKFHNNVYKNLDSKQKSVAQQALAVAGTKNTIQHLLHHIRTREIEPTRAVLLLKSIQETEYPSVAILDMLVEFAKEEIVRSEPILRQTVWLCIGSIVRPVVAPRAEIYLVKENTLEIKQKYLRIIVKQLEQSETTYEKILFVKTLANAAIDISIADLEKIIMDKKEKTVVRTEAIDALRLLTEQMPRKVQRLLMPIYNSKTEKPELRMKALVMIVKCHPEQPLLAQIVFKMNSESNKQVANFTYKFMHSVAKSSNPCYRKMSSFVSSLLRESRFQQDEQVLSSFSSLSYFNEDLFSGLTAYGASVFGKDSDLPKELAASMEGVLNGHWIKNIAELGFTQQSIEQFFTVFMSKLTKAEKQMTRGSRLSQPINLAKEFARKMNIRVRSTEREDPYAQIYLMYKQMNYAVLPIDEKLIDTMIEKFLEQGTFDLEYLKELLNVNEKFDFTHATFVHESVTKIPTSMGLTLAVSYKFPTLWSAHGKVVIEQSRLGYRMHLIANPNFATTQVWEMRVFNPIFEQGIKLVRSAKAHLPINAELEVDLRKMEFNYKQNVMNTKETLLHSFTRPVAYIRFFKSTDLKKYEEQEEKTIVVPRLERQIGEWNFEWKLASHKFVIQATTATSGRLAEHIMYGEHEIELISEPIRGAPKHLTASLRIEEPRNERIEIPKIDMVLDKEIEIEEYDYDSRTEKSRREELHRYIREIQVVSRRIVFNAGTDDEKINVELRTLVGKNMKFFRFLLNSRVPTEYSEWNLKSNLDIILPVESEVLNVNKMKEIQHREIQVVSECTWGAEKKNTLKIKMQLEQSKEQRQWTKSTGKQLRGMEASEELFESARLNQLRAVVDYDLSSSTLTTLDRFYSLVVSYNFWNSKIEQFEGKEGRMSLRMAVEPRSEKKALISIQTPQQTLKINEISMPYMVLPSIIRSPISQLRRSVYDNAECEIRRNMISTFDDVIYSAPITTCWSVVAKDCSEEPQFVVMVKNVNKIGSEKKVKIINNENTYELELVKDEMVVRVNNKIVRGSSEEYRIERLSSDVVLVELKEVSVRFDGETVKVELSNTQMNTQCGLCGHFNGEKSSELRTASDEETDDIERVHRSFIVKHEECDMDEEILSEKKNYKMYGNEEDEYDYEMDKKPLRKNKKIAEPKEYQEEKNESETSVPEKKTHIIEFSHRICFSLEPVATCPTNKINFRAAEKKVKFTCLPRHEPEARRLKNESRTSPLHIQHMPVSFVENVLVPQACEVY